VIWRWYVERLIMLTGLVAVVSFRGCGPAPVNITLTEVDGVRLI